MEDLVKHLQGTVEEGAMKVAVLEAMARANDVLLQRLVRETDGIREMVQRIEVEQAKRSSSEKQFAELAATVQVLCTDRAEARGALKATMFWATAVSGGISVAISYLFHLLGGMKP